MQVLQLTRSTQPRLCYTLLLEGRCRFTVLSPVTSSPFLSAAVQQLEREAPGEDAAADAELLQLATQFKESVSKLIELVEPQEETESTDGSVVGGASPPRRLARAGAAAARLKQLSSMLRVRTRVLNIRYERCRECGRMRAILCRPVPNPSPFDSRSIQYSQQMMGGVTALWCWQVYVP